MARLRPSTRALPLPQVTSVLPQGDVVDFSLDEVNSILADNREALMSAYDLVHAKYAFVNAIKARATAGKSVLRLGKARACKKTTYMKSVIRTHATPRYIRVPFIYEYFQ